MATLRLQSWHATRQRHMPARDVLSTDMGGALAWPDTLGTGRDVRRVVRVQLDSKGEDAQRATLLLEREEAARIARALAELEREEARQQGRN